MQSKQGRKLDFDRDAFVVDVERVGCWFVQNAEGPLSATHCRYSLGYFAAENSQKLRLNLWRPARRGNALDFPLVRTAAAVA